MEVQIVSVDKSYPAFSSVCVRCGNRELQAIIYNHTIKIHIDRSGHRANMAGQSFASAGEAMEHYQHPATKAMIHAAVLQHLEEDV